MVHFSFYRHSWFQKKNQLPELPFCLSTQNPFLKPAKTVQEKQKKDHIKGESETRVKLEVKLQWKWAFFTFPLSSSPAKKGSKSESKTTAKVKVNLLHFPVLHTRREEEGSGEMSWLSSLVQERPFTSQKDKAVKVKVKPRNKWKWAFSTFPFYTPEEDKKALVKGLEVDVAVVLSVGVQDYVSKNL